MKQQILLAAMMCCVSLLAAEVKDEFIPELKLKADLTKKEFFPSISGCYYSPDGRFTVAENGAELKSAGKQVVAVFPPKNNPMKNFQRNPFEVILEVTPLQYPLKNQPNASIFDMLRLRFQFHNINRKLNVNGLWSEKPLELNKKTTIRFRCDGKKMYLYLDGKLNASREVGKEIFPTLDFSHIRICNVDMRYHKLEFYELKKK